MSMTDVEICNLAMSEIGHTGSINNLNETTNEAVRCKALYNPMRRTLLSMANWAFAKTEQRLSLTAGTAPGWLYEYHYPQGCLKLIELKRDNLAQEPIPLSIGSVFDPTTTEERKVIWTDREGAAAIYVRDVTSTAMFSPLFSMTLVYRIAMSLASTMADKERYYKRSEELYQYHLNMAVSMNEIEQTDVKELDAEWIRNR